MWPIALMAGGAILGGVSQALGGFGRAAEINAQVRQQQEAVRVQNQNALNNWVQGNLQKTFNNAREQYQAANNWIQQLKKNQAIDKAAYEYQWDARQAVKYAGAFEQQKLANSLSAKQGSLLNALATRGIGPSSGMYASMAFAQALDGIANASQLKRNLEQDLSNIDKQTRQMQAQKTEQTFIPNIQLYDQMPVLGNAPQSAGSAGTWAIIGGALGGAASAMGGVGGALKP